MDDVVKRPKSWVAFGVGLVCAVLLIGAINSLLPTEKQRIETLADENIQIFDETLQSLSAIRDQIDATPIGDLERLTPGAAPLRHIAFDFGPTTRITYGFDTSNIGSSNTLVLRLSELRRIEKGSDPDSLGAALTYEDHNFFDHAVGGLGSFVDTSARVAYQRPFTGWTRLPAVRFMVGLFSKLETVIVYRVVDDGRVVVDTDGFSPGFKVAEAFVFDIKQGYLLGAFTFASTNSDTVRYQYRENDSATRMAKSADWSLEENLLENLEIVFWTSLSEHAPQSRIAHKIDQVPFSQSTLIAARIRAQSKD